MMLTLTAQADGIQQHETKEDAIIEFESEKDLGEYVYMYPEQCKTRQQLKIVVNKGFEREFNTEVRHIPTHA